MRLIAQLYIEGGNMQAFLEAERNRFNCFTKYQRMLSPDMIPVLNAVMSELEKALQNPENAELSMIPFAAFELNARYSVTPNPLGYKITIYAPEQNMGIVETMKGILWNHSFEVINYE